MSQFSDQEAQQFMRDAGDELFDMLAKPVPSELNRKVVFPKCRFCKRRPELIKRRSQQFQIQIRPYSKETLTIDGYELLPCCSATYSKKHAVVDINKSQERSMREQIKAAEEKQAKLKKVKDQVGGVTAGTI